MDDLLGLIPIILSVAVIIGNQLQRRRRGGLSHRDYVKQLEQENAELDDWNKRHTP